MDQELLKDVETVLHNSRVTLTEIRILEGVIEAEQSVSQGRDKINSQIIAWKDVGIGVDDIQSRLWNLAQAVCSGKPLSE